MPTKDQIQRRVLAHLAHEKSEQKDKLEGQRARRVEDYPDDLLTVLLREHEDIVERRKLVKRYCGKGDLGAKEDHGLELDTKGSPIAVYLEKAHRCEDLSALCLSGGGVRSAAFALGVIQGLAKFELLDKFDRLSTVSGGGYIGSWLTAWVQRSGYDRVLKEIQSNRTPDRRSPLAHLWRYSRYLAPRAGALSTDALTLATLYLRNLLLNWLILLPFLVLGIVLTKAIAVASWTVAPAETGMLTALAMMFAGWALLDSLLQRPGWEARKPSNIPFVAAELAPMIIGAVCASVAASAASHTIFASDTLPFVLNFALSGSALAVLAWLFAFYFANLAQANGRTGSVEVDIADASARRGIVHHVVMAAIAFAVSGAITGILLAVFPVSTHETS